MSGHSKWSTIKRQKGTADAKRGVAFTKISNQITMAVREGGGGDVDSNFKLRLAVEKAREINMPKDNIARAIEKGLGKNGGAALESAIYEGFGPHGVAIVVETITDNKARTAADLRNNFSKNGGTLGSTGTISYLFRHVGEIAVSKPGQTVDSVFEKALEAGADDIEEAEEAFLVYTQPENLHKIKDILTQGGLTVSSAELIFRPNKETMVNLDETQHAEVEKFLEIIEDMDDVQNVFVNI
jgi:YebC/PmpR family DNA-binding regulatory protein